MSSFLNLDDYICIYINTNLTLSKHTTYSLIKRKDYLKQNIFETAKFNYPKVN